MRAPLLFALSLGLSAPSAHAADDDLARLIGRGIGPAEQALAARPDPGPSDLFALGGLRVLAAAERALQLRWQGGSGADALAMADLPFLRLPIPPNPDPGPFDPALIETVFVSAAGELARAREALGRIDDADAVAVEIDLGAIWLDIDGDGARGPGEGLLDVAGAMLGGAPDSLPVRFDTADAAWLLAYAHLLGAVCEAVLALDPTPPIARVVETRAALAALGSSGPFGLDDQFGDMADLVAAAIGVIEGRPDPARSRAARDHLLAAIAQNRRFWRLVARETDNDREWIPNKAQTSVLPLPFPPETGQLWLAVLDDAEAVLRGDRLVPFWRVGPGAGLDLALLLENPPEIDLAGLVQGAVLLPYLREGTVADGRNLALFHALVRGDSVLYALVLN